MRRFRVAEDSMRPTLRPGDEFVATATRPAEVGDVVALPHPGRDDFWLVKRMGAGPGDLVPGHGRLGDGQAWVLSDDPHDGTVDSRRFGPVPVTVLLPMVTRLDEATFLEAAELLAGEDPAFASLIEEHGLPPFWTRPPGFASLVWLILEQQVSLESGAAVYRRLVEALGDMTPEAVSAAGHARLAELGTTRQKAGYIVDLARTILDGEEDLSELDELDAERARNRLLSIRGIGPWTADTYLLAALRHPDVFPLGDRALQVGTGEVLGLGTVPGPSDLEALAAPWRPVRAAAARLVWHAYLSRRGRAEPPSPRPATPAGTWRRVTS